MKASNNGSIEGAEDKIADISRENISYEDIFERRRRWGKGIAIYRLYNGKFQAKEADDEAKKAQ